MISPAEIRKKALASWRNRRFFKAEMSGADFFPLVISFRKPTGRELLEKFDEVRDWLRRLKQESRAGKGYGYTLEFRPVNHRTLGPQLLPARIVIPSRDDFLRLIDKESQYHRFQADLQLVRRQQPRLVPFLEKKPGRLLKYGGKWPQLLAVVDFFLNNPRPNRYLRELDIRGVDSKFPEQHRKIVGELLDEVLPAAAVNREVTGLGHHGFERRYYLKYDEPLIRFRFLDPALPPMPGMSDISLPVSRFCSLAPGVSQVIITENKINGLSFPPCPGSLVIFGLGYGIGQLKDARWLRRVTLWYWGDIDTHGFAILSRLRGIFPLCRSFLMDAATLEHDPRLWGHEDENQRCLEDLDHLTPIEEALYNDLRANRYGTNIRLEQERISFALVRETVGRLPAIGRDG
ncbi:MAG TPA: hypothetical protein ENK89_05595 [Desulfobulbaceae bacterium]|nr:hypothetical protein [Desulfobulbaceae bacterium]